MTNEQLDALVSALRNGEQADMDGTFVKVSRQACEEGADLILALRARAEAAEVDAERLAEALTLIERIYYMEGKATQWRAAKMNGCAREAHDGNDLAAYRRLFPRAALAAHNERMKE